MLKLEKTSDLSGLTIRMREQERFFEPRLLKALIIALILHSGALLLFHVSPFSFSSTFTFPPIQVRSDQPSQVISAFVSYLEEENDIPPPSLSFISTMDGMPFSKESTLMPPLTFDPHAFQFLEEHVWPKWHEPLSLNLEEPSIQLAISGDLTELSLIHQDPLLKERKPIFFQDAPAYVIYQVQLDEKTGEIFWYECIESTAETAMHHVTEKILLNLRFSLPETKEFMTGILHFTILPNNKML